MRIRDSFYLNIPTFELRLMYAQFTSSYDIDAEAAYGYKDGASKCLEGNMSAKDLIEYIEAYSKENEPLSSYDKAYILALKDYLKQEETNGN